MKAKTVNFKRGLDPKDVLEIGNKEVREFRIALMKKEYFYPVLQNMIRGLKNGSILEKDAIKFVSGAINKFYKSKNKRFLWQDWYNNSLNNSYWNSNNDKFIIQIELPQNTLLDKFPEGKVICELSDSFSVDFGDMFRIKVFASIKNNDEGYFENHFRKENIFDSNDYFFSMDWVCKLINTTVETVIKELG